jgi:hypothetical protein
MCEGQTQPARRGSTEDLSPAGCGEERSGEERSGREPDTTHTNWRRKLWKQEGKEGKKATHN